MKKASGGGPGAAGRRAASDRAGMGMAGRKRAAEVETGMQRAGRKQKGELKAGMKRAAEISPRNRAAFKDGGRVVRGAARGGRESGEELRKRAARVASLLRKKYPGAGSALRAENPFQLLVATVLSAQCTDKRVNQVTEKLFRKYASPEDFAQARKSSLEKEIRSTGFFRAKARSLMALSQDIVEKFGGRVPGNLEDLVTLRGVGRKTANVVLAGYFNKPAIAVDTHVKRVSGRLGLTRNTDPVKIEFDLMDLLPRSEWQPFSFVVILHGREVCKARKPGCEACILEKYCPSSTLSRG